MWDNPEKTLEKKLWRIGKSAAYAIGGGCGVWFMKLLYPHPEEADRIAALFGPLGWLLIGYGVTMIGILILRRNIAPAANFIMIAFVIPTVLFYIFTSAWSANPKSESETPITQEATQQTTQKENAIP